LKLPKAEVPETMRVIDVKVNIGPNLRLQRKMKEERFEDPRSQDRRSKLKGQTSKVEAGSLIQQDRCQQIVNSGILKYRKEKLRFQTPEVRNHEEIWS
jgi:hypothetical protein